MSVRSAILAIQPTKGQLMTDLTYCVYCEENFEDEKFDYRFSLPTCLDCVIDLNLIPDEDDLDFYRDPVSDYMETRMADAEMGDL
jgi:hypothetical protein